MDWRVWLKETLDNNTDLTDVVPASSIHGAGGLDDVPSGKPFVVIRLGSKIIGPFPGVAIYLPTLWVHDEPGDYMLIDTIVGLIRAALVGTRLEVAVPGADNGACRWIGDSTELFDDGYKTIARTTNYQLTGRDGDV